jgi:hypothetical protein
MRSFFLLAVGLALLTGCAERPEGIPSPRPGFFPRAQTCPDLRGAYALKTEGGGWSLGGEALTQALGRVPNYHSVLVIESVSPERMVLRTQAMPQDVQKAFVRWRNGEPYQYALWRHSLTARSTGEGILLERDDRKRSNPAKMFPIARTFEISGVHYDCKRGWLEFKGEDEPDVTNLRWARVRMTQAQGGGLVARAKFSFEQTFSLWCGDGCRPNISLPDGHKERWWHAPAVADPGNSRIDWERILSHDDRPIAIQNRYRDGTLLRYARQEEPKEQEPPPTPPRGVAYDCPDQRQRVERLSQPWLTITDFACTATHCTVEGTARPNRAISDAIRAMDEQRVSGLDLELIEQRGPEDIRFRVRVSTQSGLLKEGPACQALP